MILAMIDLPNDVIVVRCTNYEFVMHLDSGYFVDCLKGQTLTLGQEFQIPYFGAKLRFVVEEIEGKEQGYEAPIIIGKTRFKVLNEGSVND